MHYDYREEEDREGCGAKVDANRLKLEAPSGAFQRLRAIEGDRIVITTSPTARVEFQVEEARRALAWAKIATSKSATDWPAAARTEAEGALIEIEKLTGRVERAAMGEAAIECKAIIRSSLDLSWAREAR